MEGEGEPPYMMSLREEKRMPSHVKLEPAIDNISKSFTGPFM